MEVRQSKFTVSWGDLSAILAIFGSEATATRLWRGGWVTVARLRRVGCISILRRSGV